MDPIKMLTNEHALTANPNYSKHFNKLRDASKKSGYLFRFPEQFIDNTDCVLYPIGLKTPDLWMEDLNGAPPLFENLHEYCPAAERLWNYMAHEVNLFMLSIGQPSANYVIQKGANLHKDFLHIILYSHQAPSTLTLQGWEVVQ